MGALEEGIQKHCDTEIRRGKGRQIDILYIIYRHAKGQKGDKWVEKKMYIERHEDWVGGTVTSTVSSTLKTLKNGQFLLYIYIYIFQNE